MYTPYPGSNDDRLSVHPVTNVVTEHSSSIVNVHSALASSLFVNSANMWLVFLFHCPLCRVVCVKSGGMYLIK